MYERETESNLEEDGKSEPDNTMGDIITMMMKEYNRHMQDDNGSGLMPLEILAATNFQLEGHILSMLKDISFFEKNHEDVYKPIDEVLEIKNYFNILNATKDAVMLRLLLVTQKDATKGWLKSLPPKAITTWEKVKTKFIQQFSPPSKIAKLKKNIMNFQQNDG